MKELTKIKALAEKQGISIRKVERAINVSNGYINSKIKESLPFDCVVLASRLFSVPLEYFADENYEIDENETQLVSIYKSFNEEGKEELLKQANLLLKSGDYIKNHKSKMVQKTS